MKGVVSVISCPECAIVGSTVWPPRSVNTTAIAVSVAVNLIERPPRTLKWTCVEVAVGIAVAPPIDEPPKYASALELIFSNVPWTP